MSALKIHISYTRKRKGHQVIALRAQTLIVVAGIKCSIDPEQKPGKSWQRIYISKYGVVDTQVPPYAIVAHVCRMIEALLALQKYGEEIECLAKKKKKQ